MNKENYVDFETAMLLKKKGFPQCEATAMYNEEGVFHSLCTVDDLYYDFCDFDNRDCVAATIWDVMQWLRKTYDLLITVTCSSDVWYAFIVSPDGKRKADVPYTGSYEQVYKYAITYCLTKLV